LPRIGATFQADFKNTIALGCDVLGRVYKAVSRDETQVTAVEKRDLEISVNDTFLLGFKGEGGSQHA
jgi:hypothetical protein